MNLLGMPSQAPKDISRSPKRETGRSSEPMPSSREVIVSW